MRVLHHFMFMFIYFQMEHHEKYTWSFPILFLFLNFHLRQARRRPSATSLAAHCAGGSPRWDWWIGWSWNFGQPAKMVGFPWVFYHFFTKYHEKSDGLPYLLIYHLRSITGTLRWRKNESLGRYAEEWKEFSSLVHLFSVDSKIMLQEGSPFMASWLFQVGWTIRIGPRIGDTDPR